MTVRMFDKTLLETGYYELALIDVDISEIGVGLLEASGSGIYCIEDAISRLMDELEYYDMKIRDVENSHEELFRQGLEDPIAFDYEKAHRILEADNRHFKKMRSILSMDLETLIGAEVPF